MASGPMEEVRLSASELAGVYSETLTELIKVADSTQSGTALGKSNMPFSTPSVDPYHQSTLLQFESRLRAQGYGEFSLDGPGEDARICGTIAGIFAKKVNGNSLNPAASLSDRERAVLWIAAVATDMASQATGTDFELAGLVMPASLVDVNDTEKSKLDDVAQYIADAGIEAMRLHNAIVRSGSLDDLGAKVARAFMDWAVRDSDGGLFALRHGLPQLASKIAAFANKALAPRPRMKLLNGPN